MKKDSSPNYLLSKEYKQDHDYVFESNSSYGTWTTYKWTTYKCKKCRIECEVDANRHMFYLNNEEVFNKLSCAELVIKDIIE
jgi:ribosomal protein L31